MESLVLQIQVRLCHFLCLVGSTGQVFASVIMNRTSGNCKNVWQLVKLAILEPDGIVKNSVLKRWHVDWYNLN